MAPPTRWASPETADAPAAVPYPRDRCLHDLFDAQARSRPRAAAAVDHGRRLSYGQLRTASDALAARLRAAGVRDGDPVGVCGSRSPEALTAFLGVLKAGAAYVPLDDGTPPQRLQAMAEDAGVHTVVTLPGAVCRIRRVRTHLDLAIALPEQHTEPGGPAASAPPDAAGGPGPGLLPDGPGPLTTTPVDAGACAYVMFTSGSTGRPKPVAVPHRGVVRLAASDLVDQRPRPGERVLHGYGLSSDASTIEIWSALLNGACLALVSRTELLSPADLEARLRVERVTVAYLTTGVFHHVARTRPGALRSLRFASAGGEAMDPDLCRAVLTACPDTTVVNFYGPTENSVVSTAHRVRDLPEDAAGVPIGRPLEGSSCHVLRPDGSEAADGEEGDLLVGGDGLALGYLGDPRLTAERFPGAPPARRYRTGDRAVRRPDGELEYRARADRQIKLRGHRIELDEIEARLRAHDAVGEAVVERDGDRLTAYVTPARSGRPVPVERVRAELAGWLPAAAVPARLVEFPRFPVTSAGKVDRRRLRAAAAPVPGPAGPPPHGTDDSTLPGRLARIWETVLATRPAPTDDFFALGGDSLLAAETVTRTMAALGLDAGHGSGLIRQLLRTPTLDGFAAAVAARTVPDMAGGDTPGGAGTNGTPPPAAAAARRPTAADFRAEGRLGFTLPPPRGPRPRPQQPREVLITGASGFVGAFLTDRFLRTTGARLHCPVRSRDRRHARQRVLGNLARFGLDPGPHADRLVCFPADLAEPGLGLDADHAAELSASLDLILHSAARVNFLYPYEALRRANVDGTRQLVRLAADRRVPLHFLSTIAVLAGFGTAGVRHVEEDRPLDHPDRLTMGYAESKWVAEQVLRDAAAQGLPVAVHRPYEITGDRRTGACNTETAICSLFKTVAETGLAPDIPLPMDFVPVDYLADAVTHLATRVPTTDRTYHLTNPRPAGLHDMLDRMAAAGHRITRLPYDAWVADLVRHVAAHPTSATAPFVSLCVDRSNLADISVKEMYFDGVFPRLGRANVEHDLGAAGPQCPPVDAALLDRYLDYFYRTGYLDRPALPAGARA